MLKNILAMWAETRASTWQLFNAIILPTSGLILFARPDTFFTLIALTVMRAWAPFWFWAVLSQLIGVMLLTTRVGSLWSRVGLFLATLYWVVVSFSIYLSVGLTHLGPPIYLTIAMFTGRAFLQTRESGAN